MANEIQPNFNAIVDKLMSWGRSGLIPETKVIKSYWPPIADPTTGVQVCLPATTYSTFNRSEKIKAPDPFYKDKKVYAFDVVKNRFGDIDTLSNSPGMSDVVADNNPPSTGTTAKVPTTEIASNSINFAKLYLEAIKKSNTQAEYEENIKIFKFPGAVERVLTDFGPSHFYSLADSNGAPPEFVYSKALTLSKIYDKLDDAKSFLNDIILADTLSTSKVVRPKENFEMFSTGVPCSIPGVLNCYVGVYDNITGRKG